MDFASAMSAGGSMLNGVLSFIGGERANEASLQNSRESDARSSAEAQKQREFQQYMSNSAYQRAKNDLKEAGFNPLIALGNSASTPAGAMGSTSVAKAENTIAPAITSAIEAKRLGNEMQLQSKQMQSMDADIANKKAATAESAMRTNVMSKDLPKAEMINEAYDLTKKALNNVKGFIQGSPTNSKELESYKKGMKTWPKVNLNNP